MHLFVTFRHPVRGALFASRRPGRRPRRYGWTTTVEFQPSERRSFCQKVGGGGKPHAEQTTSGWSACVFHDTTPWSSNRTKIVHCSPAQNKTFDNDSGRELLSPSAGLPKM